MVTYRIHICPTSQSDFREIISYLNTLSRKTALEYYNLFVSRIGSLSQLPEQLPIVIDTQLRL